MKYRVLILLLYSCHLIAQINYANNWYFPNNAGITFNGTTPSVSVGSALTNTFGSAAISDANGNLLLYTDGVSIYNASHTVIPNGSGLHGTAASQPAIIIKQPQSNNIYYVFTVGGFTTSYGLEYSIVDMSLASGAGSVTAEI